MKMRLVSAIFLVGFLYSCGGGGSTTQTAEPSSPAAARSLGACSLLTAEEVKAILGEEAKPTENGAASTVSSCNWLTPTGTGLGIMLRQASSAGEAEAVYKNALSQSQSVSGVAPQDVSGFGDRAYWAGGKLNQLNVFKGNNWVIISVFFLGPGKEPLAVAKSAAERLIPRLP
jgi:hypothetical protein